MNLGRVHRDEHKTLHILIRAVHITDAVHILPITYLAGSGKARNDSHMDCALEFS